MIGARLGVSALVAVTIACRSHRAAPHESNAERIDRVLDAYHATHRWIDPEDASAERAAEPASGSFATCAHCTYAICYDDLPIERRLRLDEDADLVAMVRWLRDGDACVRRVAEHLLWPKLGLPGDALSVSVQDTAGIEYHALAAALKARLAAAKVAYDPKLFDGLVPTLAAKDFPASMIGTWREVGTDVVSRAVVDVRADSIRVTEQSGDALSPDRTWSNAIGEVRVTDLAQFEAASPPPHARHYLFWPSSATTAWVAWSNEGAAFPASFRSISFRRVQRAP